MRVRQGQQPFAKPASLEPHHQAIVKDRQAAMGELRFGTVWGCSDGPMCDLTVMLASTPHGMQLEGEAEKFDSLAFGALTHCHPYPAMATFTMM